ncbi:MAG: hypothetical protein AB7R69_01170 [Candidatus Babeliales bacterium]
MKNYSCFLCMSIIFFSFFSFSKDHYVLGGRWAGLFSNIFGVVSHLIWCEEKGLDLVVHWNRAPAYYKVSGTYNGSDNIWEYYFYPVSEAQYNSGDVIHEDYVTPDGQAIPCGYIGYEQNFSYEYRSFINSYIEKYIHIKPQISAKIDDFYHKNMQGKKTVGIHVRRTDHNEAPRIPLKQYIEEASKHKGAQFLVATDDQRVLDELKKKLPGKVIYYDSYRSLDDTGLHIWNQQVKNRALMGEQVLIETQLLSKCDHFIHGVSNVALAALFFNPHLQHSYLKA